MSYAVQMSPPGHPRCRIMPHKSLRKTITIIINAFFDLGEYAFIANLYIYSPLFAVLFAEWNNVIRSWE